MYRLKSQEGWTQDWSSTRPSRPQPYSPHPPLSPLNKITEKSLQRKAPSSNGLDLECDEVLPSTYRPTNQAYRPTNQTYHPTKQTYHLTKQAYHHANENLLCEQQLSPDLSPLRHIQKKVSLNQDEKEATAQNSAVLLRRTKKLLDAYVDKIKDLENENYRLRKKLVAN